MKAVLMNSADKIEDDGTHCPVGCLLGMDRTVLKQDGTSDWFDSPAYNDAFLEPGSFIPLDMEMGAGHLNAGRAVSQFAPGEFEADGADVLLIGWDYGTTTGADEFNRYRFALACGSVSHALRKLRGCHTGETVPGGWG